MSSYRRPLPHGEPLPLASATTSIHGFDPNEQDRETNAFFQAFDQITRQTGIKEPDPISQLTRDRIRTVSIRLASILHLRPHPSRRNVERIISHGLQHPQFQVLSVTEKQSPDGAPHGFTAPLPHLPGHKLSELTLCILRRGDTLKYEPVRAQGTLPGALIRSTFGRLDFDRPDGWDERWTDQTMALSTGMRFLPQRDPCLALYAAFEDPGLAGLLEEMHEASWGQRDVNAPFETRE